jgi:hypothetical protein
MEWPSSSTSRFRRSLHLASPIFLANRASSGVEVSVKRRCVAELRSGVANSDGMIFGFIEDSELLLAMTIADSESARGAGSRSGSDGEEPRLPPAARPAALRKADVRVAQQRRYERRPEMAGRLQPVVCAERPC